MKKRIADIVVDSLTNNGIKTCFSVVGGGSMHLNNAFAINNNIERIYNHHEQACAMAAEAYARACGNLAAVCVTSGPGGTNTINGVQGAWVDSLPMIVISGHPRQDTSIRNTGLDIRCRGVQENDIIAQVRGITKYAKFIDDPYEVRREVNKAVKIAMSGRRGPVWIDIPLDIQGKHIDDEELYADEALDTELKATDREIEILINDIKNAKRPCILTGSGIRTGDCIDEFRKFIEAVRIPIVGGSLQGDICYWDQPLYYGTSGSSGPRCGNFILQNSDLILVLGNSLSYKQTGFNQDLFAPNAKIIMVDAAKDEAKKKGLHIDYCIESDLKLFFEIANSQVDSIECSTDWINYCNKLKGEFPRFETLEMHGEFGSDERIPALLWWKEVLKRSKDDEVFALGNSSCIAGLIVEGIKHSNQRILVNYNCGSMGHDIPNAIGSAIALRKNVMCVTGDGSVMMNLQELQTIVHYNLPIKMVVFSNNGYGAIRNTCRNFFNGMYMGCDENTGISFPDFSRIADAFGFAYKCCNNVGELDDSIEWLNDQNKYCFLEIKQRTDDISGLRLASIMRDDGTFETPALHQLTPLLSEVKMNELMFIGE